VDLDSLELTSEFQSALHRDSCHCLECGEVFSEGVTGGGGSGDGGCLDRLV